MSSNLEVDSFEEAKKLVRDLRQKTRAQAQQIMAWRKAFKMQEIMISRIEREKNDQLKVLSSKLLLFESRLIRKQKDISTMLNIRETIIQRQQKMIETLSNRLQDNGLEVPAQSEITELEFAFPDLDSLNDSDSAVVMEDLDCDHPYQVPKFRNMDGVTVMRSISDAIDPNLKYSSTRRTNSFLRRPEILETVYSVEEDADNDQENKLDANKRRESFANRGKSNCNIESQIIQDKSLEDKRIVDESSSFEETLSNNISWSYMNEKPVETTEDNSKNQVKKYNRVMSNHRSVTKPKDVKYKRINKAKSKSLEELRGKLKNWVEQGTKISSYSLEHSQSYA
ncbi:uncharacterized protein LOC130894090 [Diorhabda carinulata]|uniref:uncharacterized protein LOC130894090 n=1 Tax=Diorhabda carinulata TaxID=1163345 RepID=UPI0025A09E78|nr:uncharacterized protein LOC130894090 [Diorhabda carinulata]XP_057656651.1 uncharacterized protein LOC130894090 [Diorhabda carinulata]